MMPPNKEYFEKTRELVAIISFEGQFLELSKAWEKLLGWSVEEMKSMRYQELLHSDDIQKSVTAAEEYFQTGERSPYFENRYRHKDGRYIWLQWDGYFFDDKKMYAVARDITSLKIKEFFFDEVQKLAKIGCWRINLDTNEIIMSDEIYRLHEVPIGTSFDIAKGMTFFSTTNTFEINANNLINNKEPYDIVVPFMTALGNRRTVRAIGREVMSGGTNEIYGLLADITEQVEKQNELDMERTKSIHNSKMASLGQMASNIAHEINNPLSLILGRAEQLTTKVTNKKISQEDLVSGLEQIQRTADRIAKIVKSLGKFSQTRDIVAFTKVPLKVIFDDFLGLCSEKLKNEGYHLAVSEIPDVEINCKGPQLSQVLLNLVNNSVEALRDLPEKWIKIDFEIKQKFVLIKIIDSGKGIDNPIAGRLMEPFFTTKKFGSGLGLSISFGIIDDHDGKFYYDNEAPNTTFCIELPKMVRSP